MLYSEEALLLRGRSGGGGAGGEARVAEINSAASLEGSLGAWRSSDSASARMLFHAGGVLSDKANVGASRDTVRETAVSNVGE